MSIEHSEIMQMCRTDTHRFDIDLLSQKQSKCFLYEKKKMPAPAGNSTEIKINRFNVTIKQIRSL